MGLLYFFYPLTCTARKRKDGPGRVPAVLVIRLILCGNDDAVAAAGGYCCYWNKANAGKQLWHALWPCSRPGTSDRSPALSAWLCAGAPDQRMYRSFAMQSTIDSNQRVSSQL